MSAADASTSWKNMSNTTRSIVVVLSSVGVALVVWLNFVR